MKKNFEEPKKGMMTDVEKQIISLKIERLNLEKDRAVMILNKGMIIYFAFLTLAILGFANGLFAVKWLNIFVLLGLAILIVATLPYFMQMKKEEKAITELLDSVQKKE